jgi:uncharacterized protein YkwD
MSPKAAALLRRCLAFGFVALVATAAVAPLTAAATTTDPNAPDVSALEQTELGLLNKDRTDAGLVPVRADARLMAIARARSEDMVANDYFSHTQPDGRNVFDILTADHITWYNAGEIIAWNNYSLDLTAGVANSQWMGSAGHHAIIVSTTFNYVGVGFAMDPATGKKLWTAVFMKGPDRTAAVAATSRSIGSWTATGTTATRTTRVNWSGYDPRLQVLTAGLRSFTVQIRTDGGTWRTVYSSTTGTSWTFRAWRGHLYEIRVSPLDKAGNRGKWVTSTVDLR